MPFRCFSFPLRMLFFFFVCCFSFPFSSTHSVHDDRQSLLAFKNDITDDPHASMANWSPAVPLCNWTAVTCSRSHVDRVVSLDLRYMDLGGSISPFLGNLSFLRKLNLSGNALRGQIPAQLGRLFHLRELSLRLNLLEGNIPKELGSLTHLQELSLGHNNLTGAIPTFLSNISSLTHLGLAENKFIGNIPQELGLLNSLQLLVLSENELSGWRPIYRDKIRQRIFAFENPIRRRRYSLRNSTASSRIYCAPSAPARDSNPILIRALWEASEIAGWDLDALDGKLLEKIVNRVFREVKTREVAKYPVGLYGVVEDFERSIAEFAQRKKNARIMSTKN